MKRFWETASIAPEATGWRVLLDGKPVRLPSGTPLLAPNRALAEAIAAEWQQAGGAPGGGMTYEDVRLTRLAGTAQERIAPDPAPVMLELARYGETDLLCYRATHPEELAGRQQAAWQPWLDWAEQSFGASLRVTAGVMPVAQEPAAMAALAAAVAAQDPPALAGLGIAVPALGSLVLGLALAAGRLTATEAHGLALLDELFQEEQWGADEAAVARRRGLAEDVALAGRFLALAKADA